MKYSITLAILLIIPSVAYSKAEIPSEGWQAALITNSGYTVYLSRDKAKNQGNGRVSLWVKTVTNDGNYDKALYELDCHNNKYYIQSVIIFDSFGDIIEADMIKVAREKLMANGHYSQKNREP